MKYVLAVIGASFLAALSAGAAAKPCQLKGNVMTCDSGSYVVGGPLATQQKHDSDVPAKVAGGPAATDPGQPKASTEGSADNSAAAVDPDDAGADNPDAGASSSLSPDAMLKCIEKHPFSPCR